MRPLSGAAFVHIWEYGQGRHALDRALAILALAYPEVPQVELATLSIGQRDACLLEVYAATFGARLDALVDCPQCRETLEVHFGVDDIRVTPDHEPSGGAYQLSTDGYTVRFRLLNSLDLAMIARQASSCVDVAAARLILVQRCVLEATYAGHPVALADLPETVIVVLASRLAACDPQAEVRLNLTCPACAHCWQVLFDIVSFLWARVRAHARALLRDVHTLARAYGWREADILAMSTVRRQSYLEMLA
jgi:hypothetical protein